MISYHLYCQHGHEFEGWFKNFDAYQQQLADGQICCPVCDDRNITKQLSTPNVNSSKQKQAARQEYFTKMRHQLREINHYIKENFNDVGDEFAQEARKLHEDAQEANDNRADDNGANDNEANNHDANERNQNLKGIYGSATIEELKELDEDGIEVFALPDVSKKHH